MSLVQNLKYRKVREGIDPKRLTAMLDEAIMKRNRSGWKVKKSFSPSLIGYGHGNCPRYWHMAFSGAHFDEQNDPKGLANMDYGIISHERMNKLFEESDIEVVDVERKLFIDHPPVFGFIDIIIKYDGEDAVGELKTARQESWNYRQINMKPTDSHLVQILLYMAGSDIGRGFLMYENKNTQELLVIPVNWTEANQEFFDKVISWMTEVYDNWDAWWEQAHGADNDAGLPMRPFTRKSRECKGCPIRKDCWDGPEGDVEIEKLSL